MKRHLSILVVFYLPLVSICQSWEDLNKQVLDFANNGENDSALIYGKRALKQAETEFGKKHVNYVRAVNILATLYDISGDFQKAEPLYQQALALQEQISGQTDVAYIAALGQLAAVYRDHNDLSKAITYLQQATSLTQQLNGTESVEYAKALENLGAAYDDNGEYEKAEPPLLQCREIRKKVLGEQHPAYAAILHNLALLYVHQGRQKEAVTLYTRSLEIKKQTGGGQTGEYSVTLSNLASLYSDMGEYEKAGPLYFEALAIDEKVFGIVSEPYSVSLNNVATYYYDIGDADRSDSLLRWSLDISRQVYGPEHPAVASVLQNLGKVNQRMGAYEKATAYYESAIAIREKTLGKEHPFYAQSLLSLGAVLYEQQHFPRAEQLFLTAIDLLKKSLGERHPQYISAINNLGVLYTENGRFGEAEQLLLQAIATTEKNGNENDPGFSNLLNNLALVYRQTGENEKAEQLFGRGLELSLRDLQRNFSFLSESDKEKYAKDILLVFNGYQSFYYDYHLQKPTVAGTFFTIELSTKGMILNKGIEMRQALLASGDPEAAAWYKEWISLKNTLAKEYTLPPQQRRKDIALLEAKAADYENALTSLSAVLKESVRIGKINWDTVQHRLKENEVAIEFASFRYRSAKNWTDSVMYAALVLRKKDKHPTLVPLCEARQLDSLLNQPQSTQENFITSLYRGLEGRNNPSLSTGGQLFRLIWKPLDHLLAEKDIIYFAPSGILNQLAFAAIPWDSVTLLADRYQLHQLGSTALLAKESRFSASPVSSVTLFGGIQYDLTAQEMAAADNQLSPGTGKEINPVITRGKSGEVWNYLPGTLTEVRAIAAVAAAQKVKTITLTGKKATEAIFKRNNGAASPSVLHVASHGFFFPDPKEVPGKKTGDEPVFRSSDNPLYRSGILLAGANRAWNGEPVPPGAEDGILTAYEAGNLYLGKTQLVVLSACETGLGDIRGSEGVFGLQRAFKMAGAEYLLMSLWKVPDSETAEFMQQFYTRLLGGEKIPASFHAAQAFMRKKYPGSPYKWAAFVLVR